MGKKGVKYSEQFKQDAVNYYINADRTLEEAASDLKISRSALGNWYRSSIKNEGKVKHIGSGNYNSDEAKEMAQLKRELRDTKDALEILKKALSILNK